MAMLIHKIENLKAPNFFLELESPGGNSEMANRYALYYGAFGERGQIIFRSRGHDQPVFGGKAHTVTCIYVSRRPKCTRSTQVDLNHMIFAMNNLYI